MVVAFSVRKFRNLSDINLSIKSPLVIFQGANGQGKTNILEAISICACGSSFRDDSKEAWLPFTASNNDFSQLLLSLDNDLVQKTIIAKDPRTNRINMRFWQNDVAVSRQQCIGAIPVVVFEPQDMNLFYGEPGLRRSLLDTVLVQISLPYRKAFVQAKKILTNRNHLLKAIGHGEATTEELSFWNEQYLLASNTIQNERKKLIDFLNLHLPSLYEEFSNMRIDFVVNYKQSIFDPEKYAVPEQLRGFTLSGQHRDDIEIVYAQRQWFAIASRGEMRTMILSLKAATLRFLTLNSTNAPLLLLDDIFSELDQKRRELVLRWQNSYQIFLTSATDIPDFSHAQMFTIEGGSVVPQN